MLRESYTSKKKATHLEAEGLLLGVVLQGVGVVSSRALKFSLHLLSRKGVKGLGFRVQVFFRIYGTPNPKPSPEP